MLSKMLFNLKGKSFKTVWLVGTRGISHARTQDILKQDIVALCNELLKIIKRNFRSHRHYHCSLGTIARLINGTVKVYQKQVETVQKEIVNFNIRIRKPIILDSNNVVLTKTKPKKKRPAFSAEFSLSDIEVNEEALDKYLTEKTANVAPAELITLPDDVLCLNTDNNQNDFGNLDGDAEMEFLNFLASSVPIPHQSPILPQTDVAVPPPELTPPNQVLNVRPSPPKAPEKPTTASKCQNTSNVQQKRYPSLDKNAVQPSPPKPAAASKRQNTSNVQQKRYPSLDQNARPKRRRFERTEEFFKKVNIQNRPGRAVNINVKLDKLNYNKHLWWKSLKTYRKCFIKITAPVQFDLSQEFSSLIREISSPSSEIDIPTRTEPMVAEPQPENAITVEANLPSSDSPTIAELPLENNQITVEAQVHVPASPRPDIPPAGDLFLSPKETTTTRMFAQEHVFLRPEIPSRDDLFLSPKETTTRVCRAAKKKQSPNIYTCNEDDEETRIKEIQDKVMNWKVEDGELVIENICKRNLRRFNIAVTFNVLLSMHKMGIVILNNKPNSLELGAISKGPKLMQ